MRPLEVINLSTNIIKYTGAPDYSVEWQGWGCSLAWWGNLFGDDPNVAKLMFSTESNITISSTVKNLPGLGFNIARYNVGGSCGGQRDNRTTH